jgi:acyl-CoA thioester hydrolase
MTHDAPKFEVQVRVRYAECDAFGYLHHARYLEHFELARTEMLRAQGRRYRDLEASGVFFVVARFACRYKGPIRYDDQVTIRTWVTRISRTRVDHAYEILLDGRVVTEATSTLACVGRDGRPQIMPEHLWPREETRSS